MRSCRSSSASAGGRVLCGGTEGGGWNACGGVVGREAEVEAGGVDCGSGRSPGPGSSTKGDVAEESLSEGG